METRMVHTPHEIQIDYVTLHERCVCTTKLFRAGLSNYKAHCLVCIKWFKQVGNCWVNILGQGLVGTWCTLNLKSNKVVLV